VSKAKKLPLLKLGEFQEGQLGDCFAQLAAKGRGSTRDGKPYYSCRFRDPLREVTVMVWSDSGLFAECQDHWQVGQFFKLRGTFGVHEKYGNQFDTEQIRQVEDRDRAEGFRELDFVDRSRFDPEQMFAELDALVTAEVSDPPLRQLTQAILHANAAAIKLLPASTRHAYPFVGGWLEHTLNVVRSCVFLAGQYAKQFPDLRPPLNRGLIVAAGALHDIGRVKSIEPAAGILPAQTAPAGELFGPLYLGYELIGTTAKTIPELSPELLELLLHMVVAHPRPPETGSNRSPRIPEALILHHADELDSRFEMYARCLKNDNAEGPFTERDSILGVTLLKKRSV
jgi:3'-5' exoribonuclease